MKRTTKRTMKRATRRAASIFAAGLVCLTASAVAWSRPQSCPVSIDSLALNYNHQNGQSVPQLRAGFGNATRKRSVSIRFTLLLLDAAGSQHPYPDDLVYADGLDAGARKTFTWSLTPDAVDIHRAGQTLILEGVEFDDRTTWQDDGTESCASTVDYRAH